MSTYEYRCKACGHTFEKSISMHEHEERKKPSCPKCKSQNVEQRPAAFQAVTSHKA